MNNNQPLISGHLNELYTYETRLQEVLPELITNTEDEALLEALQELYNLTSNNYLRLGHLSELTNTKLQQQKSRAASELIRSFQSKTHRDSRTAEQTEFLSLLHKYLGQMFTDYTYAINLVEETEATRGDATKILRQSLEELKVVNNRLSNIAEKKIAELKAARNQESDSAESEDSQNFKSSRQNEKSNEHFIDKAKNRLDEIGRRLFSG